MDPGQAMTGSRRESPARVRASRVTGPMLAGPGPVVLAGEGGHGLPSPGELAGAVLAGVRAGL
jgi:hypothetical protein